MTRMHIDYGNLMRLAMQSVIADLLRRVRDEGLPGDHHFFITFDTREEGVEMADWLHDRYPEEMTIVIQHWFDNLVVEDDGFSITLNFGNSPEPLVIPFAALRTFVDPSAEFGLRFETQDSDDDDDDDIDDDTPPPHPEATTREGGEVVSLDKWRK